MALSQEEIFSQLKQIMATLLKLDSKEIDQIATLNSKLRNDLGIDSVESLDFLTSIEKLFKIQISDQEAARLETVLDAIQLILRKNSVSK